MRDMGAAEAAQVGGDGGAGEGRRAGGDGAGTSRSVENQRGRVFHAVGGRWGMGSVREKCLTRSMGYRI